MQEREGQQHDENRLGAPDDNRDQRIDLCQRGQAQRVGDPGVQYPECTDLYGLLVPRTEEPVITRKTLSSRTLHVN